MNIVKLSDTAKSVLNTTNYEILMAHINNRNLNNARIFIEDKIDEIIFSTRLDSLGYRHEKILKLKEVDSIITQEIINKIDVNGAATISIQ
jgi:hypothetical protein